MAVLRTPRRAWIEAGLQALGAGGPDAVRVESLARALGVSKGGFYWHFDDRDGFLDAMLDAWERTVIDDVIDRVEAGGGDAQAKLRRLFALAAERARPRRRRARRPRLGPARRRPPPRVRRVDNRRMDYLRSQFREFCDDADEVEVRCLLVMSLFIATTSSPPTTTAVAAPTVVRLTLAHLLA